MISLLIPTRGRPENIVRLVESVRATAESDVEIVWRVDDDDPASADQIRLLHGPHVLLVGPRVIPCKAWNEAWLHATGDILGLVGDDVVMRTPGWDRLVEGAFEQVPDRIALVYGRDGFRNQAHASHPFLHQRWARTLSRVTPEHFSQDMNDVWLNEVAETLGRRVFIPDLFTQHLHPDDPTLGVAVDQTYLENRARRDRDRTHELYDQLHSERAIDVARLREAMTGAA